MYRGKRTIVIAPCYNEERKIERAVNRIQRMRGRAPDREVDEILVVDDGSTDRSAAMVSKLGASVISLGKVLGVGAALREGFKYAIDKQFDIVVVIAGNDKDEPDEIPTLLDPIIDDNYDFVQGSRFLGSRNFGHMPLYRRICTRVHPLLFSLFTGKWLTESTNGFRAFKRILLEDPRINLNQEWLDQYELEPYLLYKAITLGFKTGEVPCTKIYPPKEIGQTKMKPFVGWWSILRPLFLLRLGLRS